MADLEHQTGDERSAYYTQGLTNWIPDLCAALVALLSERQALQDRADQLEIDLQGEVAAHLQTIKDADAKLAALQEQVDAARTLHTAAQDILDLEFPPTRRPHSMIARPARWRGEAPIHVAAAWHRLRVALRNAEHPGSVRT